MRTKNRIGISVMAESWQSRPVSSPQQHTRLISTRTNIKEIVRVRVSRLFLRMGRGIGCHLSNVGKQRSTGSRTVLPPQPPTIRHHDYYDKEYQMAQFYVEDDVIP
mmetsp:Transcript_40655/g.84626  ORF Transcript_40655/g.84626 Transcript_40655/m.84626 type:complete len:106 (-) Transcript_40655:511-828(-)